MKKFLGIVSIVAIIAALAQLTRLYTAQPADSGTRAASPIFRNLPLDTARTVDFTIGQAALSQMDDLQRQGQLRDWLLYAVVSSTGMSADEVSRGLFDVPPVRYDYLAPVANFDQSDTRSLALNTGGVIALIPAGIDAAERRDRLAHIADEQRKNTGAIPSSLHVFEYEIDKTGEIGTLTRRADVPGAKLFSAEEGYVQTPIAGLADLERLLSQMDDITYVGRDGDRLIIGGRKILGYPSRHITSEHIAAIWQAEQQIQQDLDAFDRRAQAQVDALNARWELKFKSATQATQSLLKAQYDQEFSQLEERLTAEREQLGLVNGSGFSLDPHYDFATLTTFLEKLLEIAREPDSPIAESEILSDSRIAEALKSAHNEDPIPFLRLIEDLKNSTTFIDILQADLLNEANTQSQYQAARYDGALQGTETGMVLFYTDLLAKLWALDYSNSAPDDHIPGFLSVTQQHLPEMYAQAVLEQPSTRLWFGPQHRGFQVIDGGAEILFARNAARLYAASSNPLLPGVEVAPNPETGSFLGWWDRHYEQVAHYEPAYEQLNQIMKWSLLIGWLNENHHGDDLSFLGDVTVRHDRWFPDWVKTQPDLRFQDWDSISFNERGYKGTSTETLPRLQSESYESMGYVGSLSGGVSLASRQMFEEIAPLSDEIAMLSRRSFLDYADDVGTSLKTFDGVTFNFAQEASNEASLITNAAEKARMTSRTLEVANQPIERLVTEEAGGFVFRTEIKGANLGDLRIGETANGFKVGWEARDIDEGYVLAQRMLAVPNPTVMLAADPNVAKVISLGGKYDHLVQLRGSDKLVYIAPELAPSATVEEGFVARVASAGDGAPDLNLAWYEAGAKAESLPIKGNLTLELDEGTGRLTMAGGGGRAPPPGRTVKVQMFDGDEPIPGQFDPETGAIYIMGDDIKNLRIKSVVDLSDRLGADDLEAIRRLAARGEPVSYKLPPIDDGGTIIDDMGRRPFRDIADEIVDDPLSFAAGVHAGFRMRIKQVDALIATGDHTGALHQLDDMERALGPHPDIRLRKGVVKLLDGKPQQALEQTRTMQAVPMENSAGFFDEINSRLAGDLSASDRANLTRMAEFADWCDLRASQGLPVDGVRLGLDGDTFVLELHLPGIPEGGSVNVADMADGFVYVQDSPELNNLDWAVSVHSAAQQTVSGKLGNVYTLPREALNGFHPTRIYVGDTVQVSLQEPGRTFSLRGLDLYSPMGGDQCDPTASDEECDRPSYVVVKS